MAIAAAVLFGINVANAQDAPQADKVDYTTANNESAVLSQMGASGDYYRKVAEIEDPETGRSVAHLLSQKRLTTWAIQAGGGIDYTRDQFSPFGTGALKFRSPHGEIGIGGGLASMKQDKTSDLPNQSYISWQAKLFGAFNIWKSNDVNKRHCIMLGAEGIFSGNKFFQKEGEVITETDTEVIRTINGHHVKGYAFGAMATLGYECMVSPKNGLFFGVKGGAGYISTYHRTNEQGLRGHKGGFCATGQIYFGVVLSKTKKTPLYYELYGAGFNQTNAKVNELRGAAQGKP